MGLENIREIEFRYVVKYPATNTIVMFVRTLEQIEKEKVFPLDNLHQIIAKNQYVGIKDKNGKKVFEHDVVKIIPSSKYSTKEIIGIVRWLTGTFYIEPFENSGTTSSYFSLRFCKMEVLGDIYHNKNQYKEIKCTSTNTKSKSLAIGI